MSRLFHNGSFDTDHYHCANPFGTNHVDTKHFFTDCQCQYEVWAPGTQDTPWMNDAFNFYAMEVEAQREREEKIEVFITYLSQTDDPNDTDNQWAAARYSGINEFSPAEQQYIEKEVAERWQCVD